MPPPRLHTLLTRLRPLQSSALPHPLRICISSLKIVTGTFLTLHLVFSYIGRPCPTTGISMVPTIPHDHKAFPVILESRLHRRGRNIAVGDIVTFKHPSDRGRSGCKRVVGMPGDYVSVVTPGREDEDVEKGNEEGEWAVHRGEVIQVPEGHCWLAGDNLEWSRDSRTFGAVPLGLVKGKVVAVLWPWRAMKWLGNEGLKDVEGKKHGTVFG